MVSTLRRIERWLSPKPLEPALLAVGSEQLEVIFRRHASAKRLVLRLNPRGTAAIVTVPGGTSRKQALAFVDRSSHWLKSRLELRGETIPLRPGSDIPLRGETYRINHVANRRGTVSADAEEKCIHVPGEIPHLPRRLLDWLKAAAKADLAGASDKYAKLMNVSYSKISIRDQSSRWGSCSTAGCLSYSWRLILVPPHVLDYVAAHEVAHLKHMNHGPAFWRLVLSHCPDASRAKSWLKTNGQAVHRIVV